MTKGQKHWEQVKFGEVVKLNRERVADPLADGVKRYVGLEHLTPEDLRIRRWGLVAEGTTFTNFFRPGQVLFGKRRAYQRKVAVADFSGVCSGDIYVFEPQDPQTLLPELLPFICQTEGFFNHAVGTSAGSLSPRTNWKQLANYEFALPPLEEQRRIAKLLEANEFLLESLNKAKISLRNLRHSFEKKIFLMGDEKQKVFLKDLLENEIITFQTGPFGTVLKASSYTDTGHPVVNPSDMVDGKVVLDKCKFVDDLDWMRLKKYQLKTNDMFIGRKGDMQNIIFVKPKYNEYILGSDCIRFRVHNNSLIPKFLFYYLRADVTRQWLQSQAYGTVMPGINEKLLARMQMVFLGISLLG